MGKIVTRGFVAVDNSHTTALDRTVKGDSFLFGRVDASQNFEGFDVVGTVTDFSLREYGTAPWLPDLLVTADKKVSGKRLCFADRYWCTTVAVYCSMWELRLERVFPSWGHKPSVACQCPTDRRD